MRCGFLAGLALAVALGAPSPAVGDGVYDPNACRSAPGDGLRISPFRGEYRFVFGHQSDFALDAEGTPNPVADAGDHRLRLSPCLRWRSLEFRLEGDLLAGQIFGDHEDLAPGTRRLERRTGNPGRDPRDSALLREAWLQWRSPIGLVGVGQTLSAYGLGILANDGRDDDERFGLARHGDVVDRVLFATRPFARRNGPARPADALALFVAGDLVFRDENARLVDGDLAFQVSGGAAFRHPDFDNAVVVSWRRQRDDDRDLLEVTAIDVHGRNRVALPIARSADPDGRPRAFDTTLHLDYEAVLLVGRTTRFRDVTAPDGLDILSGGAVGRLAWDLARPGVRVAVEAGYASGDGDPYDDRATAFFMDPDWHVGLVFFPEMLPRITARAIAQVSDPARVAVPPKGADLTASQGRVTGAAYLHPTVRWRRPLPTGPDDEVRLLAGAVALWTATPLAQAWNTFLAGGAATNHLGGRTGSRYVGTEVLAAAQVRVSAVPDHLAFRVRLEGGVLVPGGALEAADGALPDPAWKVQVAAAVQWQ